ncbi:phosphoribosylaminoimidazole-succinocarboxamide synthase-like [Teleopsis dalmanni]|uniref:phosphoribosylaminoimidazole-succinocarboxamide synthase-like n=1 Tax=Teleopsis dalmanni TaxID=139649 RepID=UPI0018CCF5D5|nr:phosphoribosylaminoimidazole-succinocarboxamide synthase-like [Teleopsis dalmanni]
MSLTKKDFIYEGKAKQVYATEEADKVIVYYKDDATAFNAQKRGTVEDKGEMNNKISTLIFDYLIEKGIPTHFIEQLNDREQLVKKVSIIPIEMVVRNYVAGSMAQRLGLEEGAGLILADFKIEFGKDVDGNIILADEISPDTCRLWDVETGKKLDKDRFRRDLGDVSEAYHEVYNRLVEVLK